jgi:hypothetical protein
MFKKLFNNVKPTNMLNTVNPDMLNQTGNLIQNTAKGAQSAIAIIAVISATGVAASAPPVLPGIICVCVLTRVMITKIEKRSRLLTLLADVNKIVNQLAITLTLMTKYKLVVDSDPIYKSLQEKIELLLIYVLSITKKDVIKTLEKQISEMTTNQNDGTNQNDEFVEKLKKVIKDEMDIRNSFLKSAQSNFIGYNTDKRAYGNLLLNAQDFRIEITIMLTVINSYYTQLYNHALLKLMDKPDDRQKFLNEEMKLHGVLDLDTSKIVNSPYETKYDKKTETVTGTVTETETGKKTGTTGGRKTRRRKKRYKTRRMFIKQKRTMKV